MAMAMAAAIATATVKLTAMTVADVLQAGRVIYVC
jgi:hypothetical protein